jgi:Ca2+/H+ antiporter
MKTELQRIAQGARTAATVCRRACYLAGVLKVMLISVVLATFLLPALTASGKRPLSALRAMLMAILLAELAYALFLRFVYDRLV